MGEVRFIREPTVRLVGRQTVNVGALEDFLAESGAPGWHTDARTAAEELIEVAGRCCYESWKNPRPGGNKAYIGHILEVGHGSVCEHAVWNFIVTGVSRSLSHELVRHRVGLGISQLSQRYVDESDVAFVVPPALLDHHAEWEAWAARYREWEGDKKLPYPGKSAKADLYETWLTGIGSGLNAYRLLVDFLMGEHAHIEDKTTRRKVVRETARSVLPNATETKLFLTFNARSLRHFLELRGSTGADAEIRRLALAILKIMQVEAPNIFADYRLEQVGGVEQIVTEHRKV
jgi:thymidylate synthase (FAD)